LALNLVCPTTVYFDEEITNTTNCNGCLETLRRIAIPLEEMFFECKFRNQVISCKDSLRQVVMKFGLCYTFNGLDFYRTINEKDREWTIDDGYSLTSSLDAYPYRATGAGARFGFSIQLGYKKTALGYLCNLQPEFLVCIGFNPNERQLFRT
jgi:Amiloride-sensitive sodium channel